MVSCGAVFVCVNQLLLFQVFSGRMEVSEPKATTLHILVGHHIVGGWLFLVYLHESTANPILSRINEQATYMENHPEQVSISSTKSIGNGPNVRHDNGVEGIVCSCFEDG